MITIKKAMFVNRDDLEAFTALQARADKVGMQLNLGQVDGDGLHVLPPLPIEFLTEMVEFAELSFKMGVDPRKDIEEVYKIFNGEQQVGSER